MTPEQFSNQLDQVEDQYLEEVNELRLRQHKKSRFTLMKTLSMAACAAILITAGSISMVRLRNTAKSEAVVCCMEEDNGNVVADAEEESALPAISEERTALMDSALSEQTLVVLVKEIQDMRFTGEVVIPDAEGIFSEKEEITIAWDAADLEGMELLTTGSQVKVSYTEYVEGDVLAATLISAYDGE